MKSENATNNSRATTIAILFTDIVGSTRFFAKHGDNDGLSMIQQHNRALFPLIEKADGRVIKTIGDSIFAVFDNPADALCAAFAMQKKMEEERNENKFKEPIHIRVGVHYGLAHESENDFFGDAVNLAERVKSSAGADKICISKMLKEIVKSDHRFKFISIGSHTLKGSAEPMELFELISAPELTKRSLLKTLLFRAKLSIRKNKKSAVIIAVIPILLFAGFWWWMTYVMPPSPQAVAVLPFRNLANDSNLDYLSIALTDELNTQLRSAGTVMIRPTNTVMKYKGKDWDASQVARELRVGTLIEGSYIPSNDQLQVNVSIIDAKTNQQAWAGKIEGFLNNLLNLLDQVARQVISQLRFHFAELQPSRRYGTENPKAYELYLHGLSLQQEITESNNSDAIRFLEQAVKVDPKFARAHAVLASSYATRFWWNFSNDTQWLERAEFEARQALNFNPKLAEAHYALAYALEGKGKRSESIREIIESYKLDRQYVPSLTNIARYSFYVGDFDRALSALDKIGEIDPTQNIHMRRAIYLYFAEKPDASLSENRIAESRANGVDEMTFIAFTYVWLKDFVSAERMLKKLEENAPAALSIHEVRAWIYTGRGKFAEAKKEMEYFSSRQSWGIAQEMAALSALQGDKESALNWLEKAVAMGAPSYAWFSSNQFSSLRGNPRYEAVLKKLNADYKPVRAELEKLVINLTYAS
ncbi:MAG: hypothetical protein AUJ18_08310 [Candidatus Hydrogenedentes bacterium CG1_02_42_14]|nr:MAG: hypothetical protein AUJ18_08310 [Candidatus Hydrogenedentes bacterium CG1_02_42_14]